MIVNMNAAVTPICIGNFNIGLVRINLNKNKINKSKKKKKIIKFQLLETKIKI